MPAAASGARSPPRVGDGRYEAHGVQILTMIGARISRITAFNDPSLVPTFGLAPAPALAL